jgi:hypothetical protein
MSDRLMAIFLTSLDFHSLNMDFSDFTQTKMIFWLGTRYLIFNERGSFIAPELWEENYFLDDSLKTIQKNAPYISAVNGPNFTARLMKQEKLNMNSSLSKFRICRKTIF